MSYFNYHAKAKKLIAEGHFIHYEIVDNWNGISPALVLYFDNNRPMPIREYRISEYLKILERIEKGSKQKNKF
ncbi:thermostable hemolysin delta-VPH [Lachnospiraceae bacterium MD329]|nr:thermostable hemolysin delta-VPH [Lachnospiraceae bacterium MD329]